MNDKFAGLVLSISDYRENDVLMQVLSKEYGIISLIGKAAKKLNSRNHFLNFCLYEFIIDYNEGKTIFAVHGHKLLKDYFESENLKRMTFKNILCELALKNRDIPLFDELHFVFDRLNDDNLYLLGSMYAAHLIRNFGITPIVDSCCLCDNKKVVSISNRHGGFVCEKHLNGEDILPVDTLKKFRLMIKGRFANYDVLKDFVFEARDFYLLMDFFLLNTVIRIRAYDFYKTMH